MLRSGQIRGLLLEEAVLHLLRRAGYRPVTAAPPDPTLGQRGAGLTVRGRGAEHQIDAVADYLVHQPFTNPQRLLVEAKCYHERYPVDLPILRNAVGVLKDVSEFWSSVGNGAVGNQGRYHYHYAVVATSAFTRDAQRYAFAHDIHLLPLRRSAFFRPIVEAIYRTEQDLLDLYGGHRRFGVPRAQPGIPIAMGDLREDVRQVLRHGPPVGIAPDRHHEVLSRFAEACMHLDGAMLGMAAGAFPIFLVPGPETDLRNLRSIVPIAIQWDARAWYIVERHTGRYIFSFDLPVELFRLYANAGVLSPRRALDLKEEVLNEIQGFVADEDGLRLVRLLLDMEWLAEARERLEGIREPDRVPHFG